MLCFPPQLIIGNFGLSYEQSKVQVALWAVLAAPFFMSCNLRTISTEAKNILQNPLLIYINQDNLGIQGKRIAKVRLLSDLSSNSLYPLGGCKSLKTCHPWNGLSMQLSCIWTYKATLCQRQI